jgi:hypothetical protein
MELALQAAEGAKLVAEGWGRTGVDGGEVCFRWREKG